MMSTYCIFQRPSRVCFCRFVRLYSSSNSKTKAKSASYAVTACPEEEKKLTPFRLAADDQAKLVKCLKEKKAPADELNKAIAELKSRKQLLEKKEQEINPPIEKVDKAKLDDLLKQRFFYDQSFSIYGGAQGLYDFGPAGSALKANLLQDWRKFFVLTDGMLEVDCPVLTPESVLRASGHVDRFTDFLVSDSLTGESYRADHLLRHSLEVAATAAGSSVELRAEAKKALTGLDSLDEDGLQALIDRFGVSSPQTGNPLTPLRRFNLMFETSAGAGAADSQQQQQHRHRLYLRPETAQGMFTNFRRLLNFNRGRLPMAVAQIGPSYRNEIQPRSGLLRLREFTLAEIEHFYDPLDSCHPDFASVASLSLPLLSAACQNSTSAPTWLKLDAAVVSGLLANETLAYYLGRIYLFLTARCGIDARRLRFRQHPPGEMAHYASDCWDAECLVSTGGGGGDLAWVECVGCADRSAYDLNRHSEASGERLVATRVSTAATGDPGDGPAAFTPSVVEPSFGIGRILTAALEHNFRRRLNDSSGRRTYLSLPAWLAPYHCALLPMSAGSVEMRSLAKLLARRLAQLGLASWLDSDARSVSIGKRYARSDQLGVPFAVTIDFDTMAEASAANTDAVQLPTVTLRERDSMLQVRVQIDRVHELIAQLVSQTITWQQVLDSYPVFSGQSSIGGRGANS